MWALPVKLLPLLSLLKLSWQGQAFRSGGLEAPPNPPCCACSAAGPTLAAPWASRASFLHQNPLGTEKGTEQHSCGHKSSLALWGVPRAAHRAQGGCSGDPREGTDPILSTAKGKPCGTALPCCGSIWLPGWLRIKHLNFPCHNLFSQPHFLAAGWQRQEFTAIDSKQLLEGRHALLFMHDKPDLAALRGDAGSTVITPLWFKHLKSTLRLSGPVLCTDLAAHLVNSAQ